MDDLIEGEFPGESFEREQMECRPEEKLGIVWRWLFCVVHWRGNTQLRIAELNNLSANEISRALWSLDCSIICKVANTCHHNQFADTLDGIKEKRTGMRRVAQMPSEVARLIEFVQMTLWTAFHNSYKFTLVVGVRMLIDHPQLLHPQRTANPSKLFY